ncbi:MAG: 4'-phosphopantetheinyl transferase superfamily protein [Butyrivibrio sp.]|nr:4'-phosphopantetheinyl transferase superfamily protein [Butyrivibrio sp.]
MVYIDFMGVLQMKRDNRLMLFDTSVLKDEEVFFKFYEKMPKERKKKIDALKPEGSKRLCLGAGILLDKAVREYLATDCSKKLPSPSDYEIATAPQGKPYIKGLSDFSFNLSHSGDMAVIAVSDREVGVDIQKLKHFKDSLVEHVFNIEDKKLVKELVAELAGTGLTADDAQHDDISFDQVYTRMWAMKESVMKYTGKGLALAPKMITLKMAEFGEHASSLVAYIDSGEYSARRLFIQECDALQGQDSFYGISVCSDYEVFTKSPDIVGKI